MSTNERLPSASALKAPIWKALFLEVLRHTETEHPEHSQMDFPLLCTDKGKTVTLRVGMTFAHSHWTTEPYSGTLRVEGLPVRLSSGSGTVGFIVFLMPLHPKPRIQEVNLGSVIPFKGPSIEEFEKEFCKIFKREWKA